MPLDVCKYYVICLWYGSILVVILALDQVGARNYRLMDRRKKLIGQKTKVAKYAIRKTI